MTRVFFVRHAQPDNQWEDDRTRPLTPLGKEDSKLVASILSKFPIDVFYSSPYKRSKDTIAGCARIFKMEVHTDESFRERKSGENSGNFLEKRWTDFNFCEKNGESLNSVQQRNVKALKEILDLYKNKNIVIGTHGTALSTILNYYDSSFDCDGFKRIWYCMPYIIRLDFENGAVCAKEELLSIKRGY